MATREPHGRDATTQENLCRDWLDNGTTPTVGGDKPHVVLHADVPAPRGIAGGLHETEDGDIVDVDTLRMVACDCSLTRIVLGPDSEVLDVGRKTRVWTTAQRRAIIARGRHCQGPGCRAKPRYCDIHHLDHWADLGTTTVEKGKLLCRPCHTQEHLEGRHHRRIRSPRGGPFPTTPTRTTRRGRDMAWNWPSHVAAVLAAHFVKGLAHLT
jgi:hypothetical protein